MTTVYTRAAKGSALTWTEGDANITNLNNDKLEDITNESIGDLSDVVITAASTGEILIYNGTNWINGAAGIDAVVDDATPQLGGNLDVNGNNIVSTSNANINIEPNGTGKVVTTKTLNANILASTQSSGDEGGQFELALAATNTTLSGSVAIDINQNRLRIFETGGSNRGAYIDLSAASTGVGSNLLGGGGGGATTLDGLTDVTITSVADGQLLAYNSTSSQWENITVAGGLDNVVEDTTPQLGGNLDVQANSITTSVVDGNITISPNGNGDVILATDSVQVGESTAQARITSAGGNLRLDTNSGTSSGYIMIYAGANGTIELEPNGTGDVWLRSDTVVMGDDNATTTITTNGAGNLVLNTASGTNSGNITVTQGANANITITPNGTGQTVVKNLEYNENIFSLGTTSGTIAPNVTNGNVQTITLNGNLTLNAFTSPVAGQSLTLIVNTGGTSRTLTSTMKFAGGSKTLSTTNTTDIISVFYDGTTYWASLAKDFV